MAQYLIRTLPRGSETALQGSIPIYDPVQNRDVRLSIQGAIGAVRSDAEWKVATTYATGHIVLYSGLTAWESLANDNLGNIPTEGPFWTQVEISPADGITDTPHANGLFTYINSKVIHNNTAYYLQAEGLYLSEDIDAEIIAGDWATSYEDYASEFIVTGGTVDARVISHRLVIELQSDNTFTLPLTSAIDNKGYLITLKNTSGVTVTVNAIDEVDGFDTFNLTDNESVTFYISGSTYRLI